MRRQTPAWLVAGLGVLLSAWGAAGQGTFQNLDFESATIIPVVGGPAYPYSVTVADAMPGWAVYYGASQQSLISYNAPALGSTWVTLYATNGVQISGNDSVLLQGGLTASSASISQTALVPASAESLLFEARPQISAGTLEVSLGGQNLSLFALSNGPNYTLYGANIPGFAGQVEQLTFSALRAPTVYGNDWNIDNIQFSDQSVPEPGVFGLSALGALLLGWRGLRGRR
jgi:hypothetical protein